ncbi:MAG TPA: Hsp20/alpha crystallin family protein [Armatimonadota bacterium]|nr:Hsp20/alpha crystallin family protein [Armatimonadota bacterium]
MDLPWDPFGDIAEIRDRVNRIFEDCSRHRTAPPQAAQSGVWAPRVDVSESAESFVFEAELPGVQREDIQIEVEGDRLTISGERKPADGREYVRVERPHGPFHRSFAIAVPIEHAAASASFRDGVLEVTLPKAKQAQSRRAKVAIE